MKLPLDNLNYPVKLSIGDATGSGFLIGNGKEVYLVTAKHVLFRQDLVTKNSILLDQKMKMVVYPLLGGNHSKTSRIFEFDLQALSASGDLKIHASTDICIIRFAVIKNGQQIEMPPSIRTIQMSEGTIVHYDISKSRRFDNVEITNEVFVLGYPSSLSTPQMNQIDYDSPLARKGIIAGKNNLNKTLILDCPVYGGNSGGLVLELNATRIGGGDIHLVGVVVQFVPFVEQWRSTRYPDLYNTNFQNSGYSVALPVDYIYELIGEIESK